MSRPCKPAPRVLTAGALLVCSLAACGWFIHTQGFHYDDVRRTPKAADHAIPIIADAARLERPFVVIGMVRSDSGDMTGIGDRELQQGLRKEARKMGGDALINLQRKANLRGHPIDNAIHPGSERDDIRFSWVAEVISYDLPD